MKVRMLVLIKFYFIFLIKSTICFQENTIRNIKANQDETVVPVIAILASESTAIPEGQSYITASYVKLFQSTGAQIVPIPANMPEAKYRDILNNVNGVILPGGHAKFQTSKYYKHLEIAFNKSIKATWNGDHFPIFGICLGFQHLIVKLSENKIIPIFDKSMEDKTYPLIYSPLARESKMFSSLPSNLYETLGNKPYAYHNHMFSIDVKDFVSNPMTNRFFKILSTNISPNGSEVVSSIEAFEFPIFGVQWHPEKIPYEFSKDIHCNHDPENVEISFHIAAFFVNECRKSQQIFASKEVLNELLIYNYKPLYSGLGETKLNVFEQIYVFD